MNSCPSESISNRNIITHEHNFLKLRALTSGGVMVPDLRNKLTCMFTKDININSNQDGEEIIRSIVGVATPAFIPVCASENFSPNALSNIICTYCQPINTHILIGVIKQHAFHAYLLIKQGLLLTTLGVFAGAVAYLIPLLLLWIIPVVLFYILMNTKTTTRKQWLGFGEFTDVNGSLITGITDSRINGGSTFSETIERQWSEWRNRVNNEKKVNDTNNYRRNICVICKLIDYTNHYMNNITEDNNDLNTENDATSVLTEDAIDDITNIAFKYSDMMKVMGIDKNTLNQVVKSNRNQIKKYIRNITKVIRACSESPEIENGNAVSIKITMFPYISEVMPMDMFWLNPRVTLSTTTRIYDYLRNDDSRPYAMLIDSLIQICSACLALFSQGWTLNGHLIPAHVIVIRAPRTQCVYIDNGSQYGTVTSSLVFAIFEYSNMKKRNSYAVNEQCIDMRNMLDYALKLEWINAYIRNTLNHCKSRDTLKLMMQVLMNIYKDVDGDQSPASNRVEFNCS